MNPHRYNPNHPRPGPGPVRDDSYPIKGGIMSRTPTDREADAALRRLAGIEDRTELENLLDGFERHLAAGRDPEVKPATARRMVNAIRAALRRLHKAGLARLDPYAPWPPPDDLLAAALDGLGRDTARNYRASLAALAGFLGVDVAAALRRLAGIEDRAELENLLYWFERHLTTERDPEVKPATARRMVNDIRVALRRLHKAGLAALDPSERRRRKERLTGDKGR
jgi:hypothetical protein